jgi:hypothetical protein
MIVMKSRGLRSGPDGCSNDGGLIPVFRMLRLCRQARIVSGANIRKQGEAPCRK